MDVCSYMTTIINHADNNENIYKDIVQLLLFISFRYQVRQEH